MKNKKADLKIQEMAFVLVAVLVLGSLVFLFFAKFQLTRYNEVSADFRENKAINLLQVVAAFPELRCSNTYDVASDSVCIDEDKLSLFNKNTAFRNKYAEIWDSAFIDFIEIEIIFPESQSKIYKIYDSSLNPDSVKVYSTYVSICSKTSALTRNARCNLGKIKIGMIMP